MSNTTVDTTVLNKRQARKAHREFNRKLKQGILDVSGAGFTVSVGDREEKPVAELHTDFQRFQDALSELIPDGFSVEAVEVRNKEGKLVRWLTSS